MSVWFSSMMRKLRSMIEFVDVHERWPDIFVAILLLQKDKEPLTTGASRKLVGHSIDYWLDFSKPLVNHNQIADSTIRPLVNHSSSDLPWDWLFFLAPLSSLERPLLSSPDTKSRLFLRFDFNELSHRPSAFFRRLTFWSTMASLLFRYESVCNRSSDSSQVIRLLLLLQHMTAQTSSDESAGCDMSTAEFREALKFADVEETADSNFTVVEVIIFKRAELLLFR